MSRLDTSNDLDLSSVHGRDYAFQPVYHGYASSERRPSLGLPVSTYPHNAPRGHDYAQESAAVSANGGIDSWMNMNRQMTGLTGSIQNQAPPGAQTFGAPHTRGLGPTPPRANGNASPYTIHSFYNPSAAQDDRDRDQRQYTPPHQSHPSIHSPTIAAPADPHTPPPNPASLSRSTLWWGDLEPWMDEEYAKQVCTLMQWNPVDIKVPTPPETAQGPQSNNPGYCFLTFSNPAQAAAVLSQINNGSGTIMPNSTRPFTMNWSSSVPSSALTSAFHAPNVAPGAQQFQKEYSIFVGDLAPEASNSDLVAVFRNPVLGLRNDREPKFIRPFLSCKSAKIMLDPVTGVSKGYGFVRFTDEADQQRALVEMHGLYCLSRPMRISPATAKFKPSAMPGFAPQTSQGPPQFPLGMAINSSLPPPPPQKSVTSSVAVNSPNSFNGANGTSGNGSLTPSASNASNASTTSGTLVNHSTDAALDGIPPSVLAQLAQYANGQNAAAKSPTAPANSITAPFAVQPQDQGVDQKYVVSEESWKHHAQARAILSNLIGPNGEQLTSTDPYNTTVFVGGLSPLISEETLRTFFAPFGDIHYVKVPIGKHCGFVQFVRKADAERAIEKMQGFPIGGSRIRLSWGRSQYKAAQAAAQAAQAAALQAQFQSQLQMQTTTHSPAAALTPEQAMQLLQKFDLSALVATSNSHATTGNNAPLDRSAANDFIRPRENDPRHAFPYDGFPHAIPVNASGIENRRGSAFSPFSPDPNAFGSHDYPGREYMNAEQQFHSRRYAGGFAPPALDLRGAPQPVGASRNSSGKVSPVTPTSSAQHEVQGRYGGYSDRAPANSSRSDNNQHRPSVPRGYSFERQRQSTEESQNDSMTSLQDLNGTLASLDLDGQWKPDSSAVPTRT